MVANLVVCKRAYEQVSSTHVRQRRFGVGRAEDKLIRDDPAAEIRRQLAPQSQQSRAMSLLFALPVRWIAAQGVRQLLPEKRRVFSGRGLRGIEQGRARTPSDGWRDFASLVGGNDLV